MDKRRVLLLCAHPLLGESLENILRKVEDVDLVGPWDLDERALTYLSQESPDIVVVAEAEGEDKSKVSLTSQILERFPDLPVVRVGLAQNVVRLYTSRALPARSADLIEAIRSLPISRGRNKPENEEQ